VNTVSEARPGRPLTRVACLLPIDCFYSRYLTFPYLRTDLLNEYFPQAGYSLLDKREGDEIREEWKELTPT